MVQYDGRRVDIEFDVLREDDPVDPVSPLIVANLKIVRTSVGLAGPMEAGDDGQDGEPETGIDRSFREAICAAECNMLISTEVRRVTIPSAKVEDLVLQLVGEVAELTGRVLLIGCGNVSR
ncbi:unnamed protein product [Echinostoma caproni]|uniref:FtsA domain-containing protein n=1 Tax=Echinostoma caproni TaxID=27848 RepID=A0A183AM63_9TREM|nr:unnamed protein product [Echinostoma caproni]